MLTRGTSQLLKQSLTRRVGVFRAPTHALGVTNRLISSSTTSLATFNPQNFPLAGENNVDLSHDGTQEDIPWFLRSEESSPLTKPIFKAEMPVIPQDSPAFVEPLMQSLIDLGLDELKVFDLRGREEEIPMAQHTQFAVVCQGKSPKHIQNAAEALVTQLKNEYDVLPFAEGLVKANSTMKMKKKLKQKKPVNDFGLGVNSWVMLDSQMGLIINMLTPERRVQVNLEYLWCTPEERPLYEPKSNVGYSEDDSVFAGIFRRNYSTTTNDIPLEVKAVQCFQIGDIKSFESEIVPQIRQSPERAMSVIDTLITDLKNTDIEMLVTEDSETKAKLLFSFINSCSPANPTREHWEKRFEALEILSAVFPVDIPFRHLTTTLLLQASSGISITAEQLVTFTNALSGNLYHNPPSRVLSQEEINNSCRAKLEQFTTVLEVFTAEHRGALPDDVLLGVLKLATQQHLYNKTDDIVPVSGVFDVLLEVFSDRQPSLETVEFVLVTYLKANNVQRFWSFWDKLYEYNYSPETSVAILDSRPWTLLCNILLVNENDKIIDELVNRRLPDVLDMGLPVSQELKTSMSQILDVFDKTGVAYKDLRDRFA